MWALACLDETTFLDDIERIYSPLFPKLGIDFPSSDNLLSQDPAQGRRRSRLMGVAIGESAKKSLSRVGTDKDLKMLKSEIRNR